MIMPAPRYGRTTPADFIRARKPPPNRPPDAYWRGLDYQRYLRLVSLSIKARGWSHDTPKAFLYARGGALIVAFTIRLPDWAYANNTPAFGILATNIEQKGRKFYCGLTTPLGAVVTNRWNLLGQRMNKGEPYDLLTEIEEALDQWDTNAWELIGGVGWAETSLLTPNEAWILLGQATRRGLLPKGRASKVDKIFRTANQKTAWRLLTAFGKVTEQNPPPKQMDQMWRFYRMVAKVCATRN